MKRTLRRPLARNAVLVATALIALVVTACSSSSTDTDSASTSTKPTIVATTPILGTAAATVVGDAAEVVTIMPNGADPHSFAASPQQVEEMTTADLLVTNGEDLEESLTDAIDQATDAGVPTFTATDHIEVRTLGEDEVAHEDEHEDEADEHSDEKGEHSDEAGHDEDEADEHSDEAGHEEHGHGAGTADPHFWLDPVSMQLVVEALGDTVGDELDVDVTEGVEQYSAQLDTLQADNEERVAQVPESKRKLVTGHDALGYWADRYGFDVIGTVIPSTSSQAEASAGEIAELTETITDAGVDVIFTDVGESPQVAETIAAETGAEVVELDVATLPDDNSYITMITNLTDTITSSLSG